MEWTESVNTLRERWEKQVSDEYAQKNSYEKLTNYVRTRQGFLSEEARFYLERINNQQKKLMDMVGKLIEKTNAIEDKIYEATQKTENRMEKLETNIALHSSLPYTQNHSRYENAPSVVEELTMDIFEDLNEDTQTLEGDDFANQNTFSLENEIRYARRRVDSFSQELRHTL